MNLFLSIAFYSAFAALSVHHINLFQRMKKDDLEPTAIGLAQSSLVRNFLLGSAVLFAILSNP